jgi:hypothetical protein
MTYAELFLVAFIAGLGWNLAKVAINNAIGHLNVWLIRRENRKAIAIVKARIEADRAKEQTEDRTVGAEYAARPQTFPIAGSN